MLAIALVFCLSALVAGCRQAAPARPSLNVALAVFPDEASHYEEFAREFQRQSGVTINLIAQTYADILRALQAEAGARKATLDLVELDLSMLGEARPYAVAVDDLATPNAINLFPPAAWQAAGYRDHYFFVPHRLMWQAMIYNRLQVPKPPATWDELQAFAGAHPGRLALKAALYEGAICDVIPLLWEAGGSSLAPSSADSLRAMDFLATLAPNLNPFSQVFREMSVLEAQARGSVWIHFNWPFAMSYLAGKGLAPQTDLSAPMPAGPRGAYSVLGGGYLAIPRSAPHPEAARKFLHYLLTRQAQRRLSRYLGWYGSVPPPPGSEAALLYAGFDAMRGRVGARPVIADYAALSNRWQRAIREVLFEGVAPTDAVAAPWPIALP